MLSTAETAEILGISTASVKNWGKQGLLSRQNGSYPESAVLELRNKIRNGEINRLNRRANKKHASGSILPDDELRSICEYLLRSHLPPPELMFLISFKLFIAHNLISSQASCRLLEFHPEDYRSPIILKHMHRRFGQLTAGTAELQTVLEEIMGLPDEILKALPAENDVAGRIYQAISRRGDRAASGSFYTPPQLADEVMQSAMSRHSPETNLRFIDPCCGTGQFLLSFIKAGGRAENAYGIDSDGTAAFTAGTNILLQCPDLDSLPQIFCADSLLSSSEELQGILGSVGNNNFDMVVTNPPWGACTSGKRKLLEERYPTIKSGESFSYFICRALELIRKGGIVSVVVPESITSVKRHEDIRRHIMKCGSIKKISSHGQIFKGVYTPVISAEMIKPEEEESINISPSGFVINKDFTISININSEDIKIIDRLYSIPHTSLKDRAEWALGIVTGNNDQYLIKPYDSSGSGVIPAGFEPVIRGSDIQPGSINPPCQFIRFQPEYFQQTAPEWKYRASKKLVYRFISKRLIFAVDNSGSLLLNSANAVIPDAGELFHDDAMFENIMNLFNSDLYTFVYQKKFNSVKVLRSHLEQLPIFKAETLSEYFSKKELVYISNEVN